MNRKGGLYISNKELREISQSVRDRLENFLYLSDFKWVEIDEDGGVGTQVHFGYDSKYGSHHRSPKNPLKFVGDVLEYEINNTKERRTVKWIEIPNDYKNMYTLVALGDSTRRTI